VDRFWRHNTFFYQNHFTMGCKLPLIVTVPHETYIIVNKQIWPVMLGKWANVFSRYEHAKNQAPKYVSRINIHRCGYRNVSTLRDGGNSKNLLITQQVVDKLYDFLDAIVRFWARWGLRSGSRYSPGTSAFENILFCLSNIHKNETNFTSLWLLLGSEWVSE